MFETSSFTPQAVADEQEILRRSKLTPAEVRKEMRKERNVANARLKEIEQPWLFETSKPMTDPPDISFRRLIIQDKDEIDRLLTSQTTHFRQRCLDYEREDTWVELNMLWEYRDWAGTMLIHAGARESNRQAFFQVLYDDLNRDVGEVGEQWDRYNHRRPEGGEWPSGDINVKECNCWECTVFEENAGRRHKELIQVSKTEPREVLKHGVPNCVCGDCRNAATLRAEHKEIKRQERLEGLVDFEFGVPGCPCGKCKPLIAAFFKTDHNELRRKAWLRGISNVENGILDCACHTCNERRDQANFFDLDFLYEVDSSEGEDALDSDANTELSPITEDQPSNNLDPPILDATEGPHSSRQSSSPAQLSRVSSPQASEMDAHSEYMCAMGDPDQDEADSSGSSSTAYPPLNTATAVHVVASSYDSHFVSAAQTASSQYALTIKDPQPDSSPPIATSKPRPSRIPKPILNPNDADHPSKRRCTSLSFEPQQ